jgi:hypothetical protein
MWLDRRRAQAARTPERFYTALHALYPEGVKITTNRLVGIDRHVIDANPTRPIRWSDVAAQLLTEEGFRIWDDAFRVARDNTLTEVAVAQDRQRSRYYAALANWRKQYNVSPDDYPRGEAQTALTEIEQQNSQRVRSIDAKLRLFRVRKLGELIEEHGRPAYATKPRAPKLKPGEVLVTSTTLERLGSCSTYVSRFQEFWPEGTVITKQLCVEHYDNFEWAWAAQQLLDGKYSEWERTAYREQEEIGRRIREHTTARREVLDRLTQRRTANELTQEQYDAKVQQANDNHTRLHEQLNRDHRTVFARTFADLYQIHPRRDLAEYAA